MKRWVLLEHKVSKPSLSEVHFDFLIETVSDCLTWKIYEIPKLNGSLVKIIKQPNHRLVWLNRESQLLSRDRGYVQRIDYGQYSIIENNLSRDNFILKLDGKLLRGFLKKEHDLCNLFEHH